MAFSGFGCSSGVRNDQVEPQLAQRYKENFACFPNRKFLLAIALTVAIARIAIAPSDDFDDSPGFILAGTKIALIPFGALTDTNTYFDRPDCSASE